LVGVAGFALGRVLAAFMRGLAMGSWCIGLRVGRFTDPRRTYGWLEMGIGGAALLVPFLSQLVEPLSGWVWRLAHPSFAGLSVLRFIVARRVLLVPPIIMGATLPVLPGPPPATPPPSPPPQWP